MIRRRNIKSGRHTKVQVRRRISHQKYLQSFLFGNFITTREGLCDQGEDEDEDEGENSFFSSSLMLWQQQQVPVVDIFRRFHPAFCQSFGTWKAAKLQYACSYLLPYHDQYLATPIYRNERLIHLLEIERHQFVTNESRQDNLPRPPLPHHVAPPSAHVEYFRGSHKWNWMPQREREYRFLDSFATNFTPERLQGYMNAARWQDLSLFVHHFDEAYSITRGYNNNFTQLYGNNAGIVLERLALNAWSHIVACNQISILRFVKQTRTQQLRLTNQHFFQAVQEGTPDLMKWVLEECKSRVPANLLLFAIEHAHEMKSEGMLKCLIEHLPTQASRTEDIFSHVCAFIRTPEVFETLFDLFRLQEHMEEINLHKVFDFVIQTGKVSGRQMLYLLQRLEYKGHFIAYRYMNLPCLLYTGAEPQVIEHDGPEQEEEEEEGEREDDVWKCILQGDMETPMHYLQNYNYIPRELLQLTGQQELHRSCSSKQREFLYSVVYPKELREYHQLLASGVSAS